MRIRDVAGCLPAPALGSPRGRCRSFSENLGFGFKCIIVFQGMDNWTIVLAALEFLILLYKGIHHRLLVGHHVLLPRGLLGGVLRQRRPTAAPSWR